MKSKSQPFPSALLVSLGILAIACFGLALAVRNANPTPAHGTGSLTIVLTSNP